MKYLLTILILFIFIFLSSLSLQASGEKIGTTTATFLKIGVGARALGLGGAYASIGDNIDAVFYNPAGLNLTINQELSFMHLEHFADICYECFGYSKRLSPSKVLAASLSHLHMGKFTGWDKTGIETDSFSVHDSLFNITYAQSLTENIFIGTNIKFIKQKLANYSSKCIALDFGFLGVSTTKELRYGASLQNLGNKVKFDKVEDKLPLNLKFGISYKYLDEAMVTGMEINAPYDHKINYHLGSEYSLGDIFTLRLGYQSGPAEYNTGLSGGFGLKYQDFYLDYAFVPYSEELENSHYISFSCKFGPEVEEKIKQPRVKKRKKMNFFTRLLKKDSSPEPAKKTISKKPERYIPPEDSTKTKRTYRPPGISKRYPEKYQKVKETGSLSFENYLISDIFEEQDEFILREKRDLGTWTIKREVYPKKIPKKSPEKRFEPLDDSYIYDIHKKCPTKYYHREEKPIKEKEDFDSYDIYKKYSITPPSKYYREEKPAIDKDWQYYAYDPDTYEYFKKKYGLKEDTYKSTYEEHPDLKAYPLKETPREETKTPYLPPKEVIIEKEVKEERIEEKKPITKEKKPALTPIKKEDISQEEDIWKNIGEEIIRDLCE